MFWIKYQTLFLSCLSQFVWHFFAKIWLFFIHAFFPPYGPVYHYGINWFTVYCSIWCSSYVKLNKSGSGWPLGSLVFGSRSSSKYGSRRPPRGVGLPFGSYWRSLDTNSIASLGVLCLKTLSHGRGLICGNLYSL